jgi:hypothetical protein
VVESLDHPATVQEHERLLLKMLAQSSFGSMLNVTASRGIDDVTASRGINDVTASRGINDVTASRNIDDVTYKVPFVDTLHVLRNIFMEQVITEDEKKSSLVNNHFSATNMSPTVTPTGSAPTTPIKSAAAAAAATTPTKTAATTTTPATAKKSAAPATESSAWLSEENTDAEVSFTPDEESWINKQLVKFQSSYREVGQQFS